MRRVKELDGLRAVAILAVLGCHFAGFAERLGGLPEFGWAGVDIFFALSGYLITTILLGLRTADRPYTTFYSRRTIRIFPVYLIVLLGIILLNLGAKNFYVLRPTLLLQQLLFLQSFRFAQFGLLWDVVRSPLASIQHLSSLLLLAHHLPRGQVGLQPYPNASFDVFWSLSVEEYFYILWAPIVLCFSRRLIGIIALVVCPLEMLLRWVANSRTSYFGMIYRQDALIYGALLALLFDYWHRHGKLKWSPARFKILFAVCISGILAMLIAIRPVVGNEIRESLLFEVFGLPLISIAAASVIGVSLLKAESSWWLSRLLRSKLMQYLGTISYTLYLVHVPVYAVVGYLSRKIALPLGPESLRLLIAISSTVLSIGVARLSWHYFEYPLLRWKDKRFPAARVSKPTLH